MSVEKVASWGTIICAVCAPIAVFFAAAAFVGWTPKTFQGLGVISPPVGVAVIVLLLVVTPWIEIGVIFARRGRPLSPTAPFPPQVTSPVLAESLAVSTMQLSPVYAPFPPSSPAKQQQSRSRQNEKAKAYAEVEPEYLYDIPKKHLAVEAGMLIAPYIGKWLRVSGVVDTIYDYGTKQYWVILKSPIDSEQFIALKFGPDWADRVSILHPGQFINASGQIETIRASEVGLKQCELMV